MRWMIFRWMICKPLKNVPFIQKLQCTSGPGFQLISPESNSNNWEKQFKFLYLNFEIKKNDLWLVGFPITEYSHKYQSY